MEKIKRTIKGKPTEFPIYTQEEADTRGIEYVHWSEAQAGEMALSDDGYIGACISRKVYTQGNRERAFINICYGYAWENYDNLSFIDHRDCGAFTTSTPKTWDELEAAKPRTKLFVRAYVDMYTRYARIDWRRLGQIYRPDLKKPAKYAKKLMSNPGVQKMIKVEIQKVLEERGINEGQVIDNYKDIYEKAETKDTPDLKMMKQVNDEYSDILQMKGNKTPLLNPLSGLHILDGVFNELENETQKQLTNGNPTEKPVKAEAVKDSADGE